MSRKVVTGKGIGVTDIDTTGYKYAKFYGESRVILVSPDPDEPLSGVWVSDDGGGAFVTGKTIRIDRKFPGSWSVVLFKQRPATDQSTISITKLQDGTNILEGDEDVVFKNEGVDISGVDISDVRHDFDSLSRLYQRATSTKTANDQVRYLKLKSLLIK
ncbi:hypothetical protein [Paenibacillus sp. 1781tsa1]|uniref:hypothetical protein n=1 Tax=Paenibacillus sp. 1781tsa1 TaxID=2953810 RepID=UPI00209CD804|nr:hypothetical protein [Paenibacillus sp. 1781tsa1]MCP1186448.1 hypothetical protein [Paenibacillus sp. 1781tsa1]